MSGAQALPLFDRIAVLGVGLLGASVALAAREKGAAREVTGAVRNPAAARELEARGVLSRAFLSPEAACEGAQLVVLCTPVSAMPEVLARAAAKLAPGAIITDVGSVKLQPAEALPPLLPRGAVYVGAHPMAGGHQSGFAYGRAGLFAGKVCIVCAGESSAEAAAEANPAVARVAAFWRALGCTVVFRTPQRHDEQVAWVSHAPHAAAFAFAHAFGAAPQAAAELRGPGFHSFTRIAKSNPELWCELLLQNRAALEQPLSAAADALSALARAVQKGDAETVRRFLESARNNLDAAQTH